MTAHSPTPNLSAVVATPAYVLDMARLKSNIGVAARIKRDAGCKLLLATKAWAMPAAFPAIRDLLDGTTASGEYEARMGREEFGKEVHVYAPAFTEPEVKALTVLADHIYFNSPSQLARFAPKVKAAGRKGLAEGLVALAQAERALKTNAGADDESIMVELLYKLGASQKRGKSA